MRKVNTMFQSPMITEFKLSRFDSIKINYSHVILPASNHIQTTTDFLLHNTDSVGRGSSIGISTRYGLDTPRIESRWRQDFPYLSKPALGPTQPPI